MTRNGLDFEDFEDTLPGHPSRGRLERILRRGEFAVTAELTPPDSADPNEVFERGAISTAGSTALTPPMAPAPTAICPVSASAPC